MAAHHFGSYRSNSGSRADIVNVSLVTQCMDPPCVARENGEAGSTVLHQCIRPRIGTHVPGHHGIRARPSSLAAMPRRAIWVISSRMRWKDHFSISSFSLADLGGKSIAYIYVSPCPMRRARSSHGLGRRPHRSDLKVTTAMENAPGDAGDFIGERDRQLEAIEPPGCGLDPGFEAMLLPALRAHARFAGS